MNFDCVMEMSTSSNFENSTLESCHLIFSRQSDAVSVQSERVDLRIGTTQPVARRNYQLEMWVAGSEEARRVNVAGGCLWARRGRN